MSDDFVHKDVVDEMSRRYEAQLAAAKVQMSREVDRVKAEFEIQRIKNQKDIEALADAVNAVNQRIDDIKDFVAWGLTVLGVSISVIGLVVSVVQIFAKR